MTDSPIQPEEALARIARITPDAGETRRVLERLAAGLPARAAPRRRAWRWIIPTSIAAAVLTVATVFLVFPVGRVSAQQSLATTIAANEQYKGWVHLKEEKNERPTIHWNTLNGSNASNSDKKGDAARFVDAVAGITYAYHSETNTIHLGVNWPEHVMASNPPTPLNFATLLERLREVAGEDSVKIVRSNEGNLERFDLTISKSVNRTLPEEFDDGAGKLGRPSAVWVDPRTRFITAAVVDDRKIALTYGAPEIQSIYDLGVPRDARTFDNRPTPDAMAAVKRVLARINTPFPDGVVVRVTTDTKNKMLALYARQGKQWAKREYAITVPGSPPFRGVGVELPDRWSDAPDELLRRLAKIFPFVEYSGDGTKAWRGEFDPVTGEQFLSYGIYHALPDGTYDSQTGRAPGRQESIGLMALKLERIYSPTRWIYPEELYEAFATDNHLDLTTDPARPGQVCFRVIYVSETLDAPRFISQEWIDPAHDDRPVTTLQQSFSNPKTREILYRVHNEYSDYARLPAPDGRWFPTRWVTTTYDGADKVTSVVTSELHFFPDLRMPPLPEKILRP